MKATMTPDVLELKKRRYFYSVWEATNICREKSCQNKVFKTGATEFKAPVRMKFVSWNIIWAAGSRCGHRLTCS